MIWAPAVVAFEYPQCSGYCDYYFGFIFPVLKPGLASLMSPGVAALVPTLPANMLT